MKTFLAVFTTPASRDNWDALDAQTRAEREKAGMIAWHQWMADHEHVIVDKGGPLGKTKQISLTGINDTSNNLGGFLKLQAESQEAAAKMFENHPSFAIFPGDGVEVMECMPIPTMS
jgi:hypothetical protein